MEIGSLSDAVGNLEHFDFIGDIPGFFDTFIHDVVYLMTLFPDWLRDVIFVVVGIMMFICALRVVAYILDAIPFA